MKNVIMTGAGKNERYSWKSGQVLCFTDLEADEMIKNGIAIPYKKQLRSMTVSSDIENSEKRILTK